MSKNKLILLKFLALTGLTAFTNLTAFGGDKLVKRAIQKEATSLRDHPISDREVIIIFRQFFPPVFNGITGENYSYLNWAVQNISTQNKIIENAVLNFVYERPLFFVEHAKTK